MGRPSDAEVDLDLTALAAAGKGLWTENKMEGEERPSDRDDGEGEEEPDDDDDDDETGGDDSFFESLDRVPSGVSFDLDVSSSGSESEEEDDDVRISFASAIEGPRYSVCVTDLDDCFDYGDDESAASGGFDYGIWMAEPVSLTERRRRLLQGMGLTSSRDLAPSVSRPEPRQGSNRARIVSHRFPPPLPPPAPAATPPAPSPPPNPLSTSALVRCRSDSHWESHSPVGDELVRSFSSPPSLWLRNREGMTGAGGGDSIEVEQGKLSSKSITGGGRESQSGLCLIKNLDDGKEFMVSEVTKDGSCGRLNDVQTGMQLTMDEFERFLGFSPIVKELMRRANVGGGGEKNKNGFDGGKSNSGHQGYGVKSSKSSGRKKVSWLKNIKSVASSVTGFISEKEKDHGSSAGVAGCGGAKNSTSKRSSLDWLKVRQHGKSYKELTGLYMCQEIQAHEGSIWCIKFSCDGRFMASAGEDRIVHVWQVMNSDTFSTFSSLRRQESRISAGFSSLPSTNGSTSSRIERSGSLSSQASMRMRKGSKLGSRRRFLPDYIVLPETIFSLSEKPVCSFEGHLDDVLDLSWSKSQHLLSSSMDKTVRLWDMEKSACLKLFAHNDYVTCIQFNPIDDNTFISGSLDAKVRIWSISERQVVDWSDLHEMVTAVCYTPDGQGALVGSHKGSLRFYSTADGKLCQETQIGIRNKKRKSHAKKITGFQYAPDNPSEVMVTSADSLIRVFDGADIIHKFRGFRNTSSQISASFTTDGKYVVCASEDSHVYIWKRDAARSSVGGGKAKTWVTTRSHEYFYCKDVSVAVPWPNIGSTCQKPNLPSAPPGRSQQSVPNLDDPFSSGGSQCPPPLPRSSSGPGISPPSSRSLRSSVNSSSSSSSFGSWGWGGGSNRIVASNPAETANAWGLVVVTAGLRGHIRIYQNFGLPVRLGKQTNLF